MAEAATKLPVKAEHETSGGSAVRPLEALRREIDRLFENFDGGFWRSPFRRSAFNLEPLFQRELTWSGTPAVDIVEKDKAYEITAELPGIDEKNVEVNVANGMLVIKGEKKEEKEEKKKDFYLSERRYGSFERRFQVPQDVEAGKIDANFRKGVLTVTLPKKSEAQKPEKKIEIKAA
jgi:HSP20 family protein